MIGLVAQEAIQRPTSCHAPYPEPVHQCWRGVSEHTRRVLALVALCRVLSAVLKSEAAKCGRAYRVGSGPREAQFFYIHEGGKLGRSPRLELVSRTGTAGKAQVPLRLLGFLPWGAR